MPREVLGWHWLLTGPQQHLCSRSPSVVLDPREWRHFKELTQSVSPVEEEMFHLRDDLRPQVYLRPNETVRIPFKYQTFSADPAVIAAQVGAAPVGSCSSLKGFPRPCLPAQSPAPPWRCHSPLSHPQGPAGLGAGANTAACSLGKSGAGRTKHIQVRGPARVPLEGLREEQCRSCRAPSLSPARSPSR